ncbi:MAG: hypothetical protein P6D49_06340 [Acidimicrobiales bacterium]|nr:hypothetical protein [Acidimicrobiales bacterium]
MGRTPLTPPADRSEDVVRRGPADEDELYLDEILALTPIKRTRLYTFRDRGRFGPVREAPGPTCPRPVFLLEGVAGVCEELGYPPPTVDEILAFRASGGTAVAGTSQESDTPPVQRPPDTEGGQRADSNGSRQFREFPHRGGEEPGHQPLVAALHAERVRQLEGEHEALRAERDRARAEEAAGRERAISLEADLRITDAARERALEDLVARESRIRRLESDLEERTSEAHRLNAEHRGVQGELRQAVAERDAARGERSDLRGDRDALREDLSDAREENAALRPEVELLRANTTRGFRRRQRRQAKRQAKSGVDTASADGAEASSIDEAG